MQLSIIIKVLGPFLQLVGANHLAAMFMFLSGKVKDSGFLLTIQLGTGKEIDNFTRLEI